MRKTTIIFFWLESDSVIMKVFEHLRYDLEKSSVEFCTIFEENERELGKL